MTNERWDRRYAEAELTWPIQPHPQLAEALADLPPGRAVDLGCGEGRQAIWLAGRGWQVLAVDFSPVAIDRGRQLAERHGADVDWVVASVLDHELAKPVDLAVVLYLHLPPAELVRTLRGASAGLAPGGTLLVLGWDRQNSTHGTGGPRPPAVFCALDDLAKAVTGLRIVRAEQIHQAGSSDALEALFIARRDTG